MKFLLQLLLFVSATALTVAQTNTLNVSQDLVRLGVTTANLVPNQASLDSGPLLEAAVRYANSHQISRVVADPGAYYFLTASSTSAGAHAALPGPTAGQLTIDWQGSDLYFAKAGLIGLFLTGGSNLTLQNLTMDYLQLNYTQAVVTSVNAAQRQLQFTVSSGWQNPSALNALLGGSSSPYVYVFRNGQPWLGFTRMAAQAPFSDNSVTLTSATSTAVIGAIQPGDVAVIQARTTGNTLLAQGLMGATLRNIKIFSGGSGLRLLRCSSCLVEHVEVMPRPGTDRLISTVADGFQPQQLGANNTFRLCRSIRTCDDGFSPVTFVFGSVRSLPSSRSVQVQGDATTALASNAPLPNGSNVVFERASDGAILGSAVLVSQAAASAVNGLPQIVLNFDRDVPSAVVGTYIYATDPGWRAGNLLLERNTVQQQGWARGISVWGVMNATLYGNYIRRSTMAGIDVKHQLFAGDWLVPPSVNVTIVNNVIDGTILAPDIHSLIQLAGIEVSAVGDNQAPMASSPHQNIAFTSNFVANPGRAALWMGNVAGALIDTNYLLNPNDAPAATLSYPAYAAQETLPLVVQSSSGVSVGMNVVDQASRRAFATDGAYRELAAYAPGMGVRLNAYNLGGLTSPTVTLTDADRRTWSLASAVATPHALDVTLPSGVGLGGAYLTVRSGSINFQATLFIDTQDNVPALNQSTFLISPSATAVGADATALPVLVITQGAAAYRISLPDAFVTGATSGAGTGVVTLNVGKNTGAGRASTIDIAGQPLAITQAGASDPVFASAPQSQAVSSGSSATLSASASGVQSYQWLLNGAVIPGATQSTFVIPAAAAANVGTYSVIGRNASGATTSSPAVLTLSSLPSVSRLANLSILTSLTATTPNFTLGTVVSGAAGSKALLIRAGGPALTALGVGGALPDPRLDVYADAAVMASNDDWGGSAGLSNAFAAVGAFPYPSADSKDSAVFNPGLPIGGYTVQVGGVGGVTGTVIAELYDSTPSDLFTALTPRLINVSVRKQIDAGDTLTVGFVIVGATPKQVLIRAVGPTMGATPFNVPGVMADPKLTLFSGQDVLATNDNWGTPVGAAAASAAQLATVFGQVGAFALAGGSKDAALLVTLPAGNYTAQVTDAAKAGGQALVEVYEVP